MRPKLAYGRMLAAVVALAIPLAGCSGSGSGGGDGSGFSVQIANPERPLWPTDTSEQAGLTILRAIFTPLVTYDVRTNEARYDGVAESIESGDNINWKIKLKSGWTFHDGSAVTSDSFIKAWNYAAYGPNAQGNAAFFDKIAGFAEVHPDTKGETPKAETMSGLQKVSDTEFTVKLSAPFAQFPTVLGYVGFAPLPEKFFSDKDGFGKKPIGNGPFQAASAFETGKGITLEKYEKFAGRRKAKVSRVELRTYSEVRTGYLEVQSGALDISSVPPDNIATAKADFGARYIEERSSLFTYLGFPLYDKRFEDVRVRRALAMAIDRKAISDKLFNGTRVPAMSLVSPVVPGHREDPCKSCKFNPEEANRLLNEAKFDRSTPITLWLNAGAGHDEWVKAVGDQWRKNLNINFDLNNKYQFDQYLPELKNKRATGPYRAAWGMDYPSPQNYLEPVYGSRARGVANNMFYSNPRFDELVKKGNEAKKDTESLDAYKAAEDVALEDMPVIPMFWGRTQVVHSERVNNVRIDGFSNIVLEDVTLR